MVPWRHEQSLQDLRVANARLLAVILAVRATPRIENIGTPDCHRNRMSTSRWRTGVWAFEPGHFGHCRFAAVGDQSPTSADGGVWITVPTNFVHFTPCSGYRFAKIEFAWWMPGRGTFQLRICPPQA